MISQLKLTVSLSGGTSSKAYSIEDAASGESEFLLSHHIFGFISFYSFPESWRRAIVN